MEKRFAATIANPLGAKQESQPEASVDNVVTAVRRFSESLLTNRVSKEIQQEVEALASHMEVLISRRRLTANQSRSPSVAETQVALRNLKRFLEREANKERVKKKPSASCTTDTLESSCSHIQAFSPGTVSRTRSLRSQSVDIDGNKSAACGSRGDTGRPDAPAAAIVEKMRHRCCLNPASSFGSPPAMGPVPEQPQQVNHKRKKGKERKPPPPPPSPPPTPPPLNGPAQLVQLTCSDELHLLLLVEAAEAEMAAEALSSHVLLLTEYALPEAEAAETQLRLQLMPAAEPDPCVCPVARVLCLCQGLAHTERAPLVIRNRQLEREHPVGVAIEMAVEQPMVEAECERGDCGKRCSSESAAKGVRAEKKAVIEEQQGNSNCASVSSHVAIVSWAKATTIVDLTAADLVATVRRNQWNSNQMVSTCSCPSDSDVRKASEATNACEQEAKNVTEKNTEDSVELQTSSAMLQPHSSIQAAPMRLEQRVCESSSPEMLVSSTSILTVDDDPGEWQQPLFRIVDLERLVHMAAPMARSESPTEAPGVTAASPSGVGAGDSDSGRSKSTLEVVDQSGDVAAAAGSVLPSASSAAAAPAAAVTVAVGLATSSVTHADPAAVPGCTWSSCEVGHSSGFTKLLLTLDKAAKRRRELARGSKRSKQKQRTALNDASAAAAVSRGRRTSRSGNNSSRLRSQQHHQQTPPTETLTLTPLAPSARRQEEALRLAARSLAGLARSLQLCVRRVHDAADAINCTL